MQVTSLPAAPSTCLGGDGLYGVVRAPGTLATQMMSTYVLRFRPFCVDEYSHSSRGR